MKIIDNEALKGRAIRLAILSTHYKSPLDWNDKKLKDAEKALHKFYKALDNKEVIPEDDEEFVAAMYDDMNTPKAIARLHVLAKNKELGKLMGSLNLIGLGVEIDDRI